MFLRQAKLGTGSNASYDDLLCGTLNSSAPLLFSLASTTPTMTACLDEVAA